MLLTLGLAGYAAPVRASVTASPDILINSTLDISALDSVITLREALDIANGDLTGPFSVAEQAQLPGCAFSIGSIVAGSCGAGVADEIGIDAMLGATAIIALGSALPAVNDTQPTTIDGIANGFMLIVDASGAGAGADGLIISSNGNLLSGLFVISAPRDGIAVLGAGNTISMSGVLSSTRNGVWLAGGSNLASQVHVGLTLLSPPECAGQLTGFVVTGNDNALDGITAACSTGAGIDISGAANTRVQYSAIGDSMGNPRPNATGIVIRDGAVGTQILTSTIRANTGIGVWIRDAGTENTQVAASVIANQGGNGVQIDNGAANNLIGGPGDTGNTITENAGNGVYIAGASTHDNRLMGNYIGTDELTDRGNSLNGVVLDLGTHHNQIGYDRTGNVIGGNDANGVLITNGALSNTVLANTIGANRVLTLALPNSANGVLISAGAEGNYVGAPLLALGSARARRDITPIFNIIAGNGQNGVALAGAATRNNTIGNNMIGGSGMPANGMDGVSIDGAHNNMIGDATISYNGGSGIYLHNGAQGNAISFANVLSNTLHGIVIDGSSTTLNVITATLIAHNGLDGIAERNGATANGWRNLSVAGNGGLGIDKDAVLDAGNIVATPATTITAINLNGGVISGTARFDTMILANSEIDIYRIDPGNADPSGHGEGSSRIGVARTDSNGNWSYTDVTLTPGCYTAVVTEYVIVPLGSSEFARNVCIYSVSLPMVVR